MPSNFRNRKLPDESDQTLDVIDRRILRVLQRDGSIANVHIENRSGSPTLDTAAMRALQRIDSFGPLPEGDHITIEDKFDYKHQ